MCVCNGPKAGGERGPPLPTLCALEQLVEGLAHIAAVADAEDDTRTAVAEAVAEVAPALAASLVSVASGSGDGQRAPASAPGGVKGAEDTDGGMAGAWMLGERPLLPPTRPLAGTRGRARALSLARLLLGRLESGAVDAETQRALARLAAPGHATAAAASGAVGQAEDEDEDEL